VSGKRVSIEQVLNILISFWVVIFLANHLLFKYVILNNIKNNHIKVWLEMGSPTIFSSKESQWALIGFMSDIDVLECLKREKNSVKIISLLKYYRCIVFAELVLLCLFITLVFIK
tara:strand:+ start:744 stop:1088 length:345 start_codon:yes stop_codon:yes gene_type:complete